MAEQPSTTDSPGVLNRLVRSLSSTKIVNGSKSSLTTGTSENSQPESSNNNTSTAAAWRKKISAIDRFKTFGKSKKDTKVAFPPPAWFEETKENDGTTAAAAIPLPDTPAAETEAPSTRNGANLQLPVQPVVTPPNTAPQDQATVESGDEPSYIARKIQTMMDAFQLSSGSRIAPQPQVPETDDEGRPIPPPPPAPINDSKLISLLSSASVMNGSIGRGTQSVWSVLENLRAPKRPAQRGEGEQVVPPGGSGVGEEREYEHDFDDDNSSVMICSPLIPGADSKVLLADSEMVPCVEDNQQDHQDQSEEPRQGPSQLEAKPLPKRPSQRIWPWKAKEHRVWVPSATNISVQATWWGFRIYLPPPVLDILNGKQIEAAKRAAMITTALKWLLDHLPVKLLPLQFRPIVPMIKQLTPYLGYIGVFIAWSWGAIKMYDKGHGVVLSATWILPVALIPSTWDANDFPPITVHMAKPPAGEDNDKANGSEQQEDTPASAEGNGDAMTSPGVSKKGKERAY